MPCTRAATLQCPYMFYLPRRIEKRARTTVHRLGIDIGSKTIKLALLDDEGQLLYSDYLRHQSKVKNRLLEAVHRCAWMAGDREVQVTVTGSAGMRVAELFDVPFVQEVVALKHAVEDRMPDTDVVLEMGGEDTKLVYLTGTPEQRMNTVCAGGTGGFIDMMAGLMGVRSSKMQNLALGANATYPIASRCAVFAKSDVRPLLNAGVRKEDVAASVLEAVCTQAVAGLSAGRPIEGKVALLGGPFQYIPYLRRAFCKVTGIPLSDATIPDDAHLTVAIGAALSDEASESIALSALEQRIEATDFANEEGMRRLPTLFSSKEEYEAFKERHAGCTIPRGQVIESNENLFIGIDAGSTTMKMALINEAGELCAYQYEWNEGDVTESLPRMLELIYREFGNVYMDREVIRRSCIVGYGEDFCRAAYRVDMGEVETVAHLRAARELASDVDFLMDIGGQDIKCFYVKDGVIDDIVLNEACSSGCGSLFDSMARSMGYTKEGFAALAVTAKAPVDLGTRCATFMESRVKHAQKEGADIADIAAGVSYSTARNALFKVVRQPDFKNVGKRIMVQGGAFANDALLRAFELETGTEVLRPNLSQIMGAWGAALLARDEWLALKERDPQAAERACSGLLDSASLKELRIRKRSVRCDQCPNACRLAVTSFTDARGESSDRFYVTGNRCERGALAAGGMQQKAAIPPNMVRLKNELIAACDAVADIEAADAVRVGIPKALALYESYPYWHAFFTALGCTVVAGGAHGEELFRKGMSCIPAEGACYPSKLVYGHCADLAQRGAQVIFVPSMSQDFAREGLLGLPFDVGFHDCPLIERMGDMVHDNALSPYFDDVRFLTPDFAFAEGIDDVAGDFATLLQACGIDAAADEVRAAAAHARETYRCFFDKLEKANARVLARIDAGEFPGALVAGHPYHADPDINHGIDELAGKLGYAVIEQVDYHFGSHADEGERRWFPERELLHSIVASEAHPNLQLIIPRSFGCGIDALFADAAHERIRSGCLPGEKPTSNALKRVFAELKIDQIVDLAAVRIRLRSLAYANRQRGLGTVGDARAWNQLSDADLERIRIERRKRAERKERQRLSRERAAEREATARDNTDGDETES